MKEVLYLVAGFLVCGSMFGVSDAQRYWCFFLLLLCALILRFTDWRKP